MIGASPLPTYTGRALDRSDRAGNGRPRVVTVFVLDAMRADYFDKYASVMPTLTRMRKEGAWLWQRAHRRVADRHRRRPRQHRHRQRAALSRHRRQQPLQPRHRQVAGSLRSARHARADGADARRSVEPHHRRQGDHHRPGRRDSRHRGPGRPRRVPDQRQEDPRRQLRRRGWRMGNQSRPATRCPRH